ncbi:MAG: hypothetical protein ABSB41_10550 [Anaerolineales bacterium]
MFKQSILRRISLPLIALILVIAACALPTNLTTPTPGSVPTATFPSTAPVATAVPTEVPGVPTATPPPTATFTSTPIPPTATPTLIPVTPTAVSSPAMVTPLSVAVNCRYATATTYVVLGDLMPGHTVPILGTNTARNWWQIQNPDNPSQKCWVGNPVVITSGDIADVPVVPVPTAYVTKVTITSYATTVHGTCGGPNANGWTGNISTNGPVTVTFHWEIWNTGGSMRNATADQNLVFASWGTLTDNPGSYSTDCGKYTVKLIVTVPNNVTAQVNYQVVHP